MCSGSSSSNASTFFPPSTAQGMTEFDKSKFEKQIRLPILRVPEKQIGRILGLKPLQKAFIKSADGDVAGEKLCLLDPDKLDEETTESILSMASKALSTDVQLEYKEFLMKYEDWDVKRCLKAILPDGLDFSSHTQTGHILHLNLREELLPYKFVIAKILMDKIPYAKTIVNKTDKISAEFRFFELELLAGEPNFEATVTEHSYKYKLDFSKVFWNSRLLNEHNRIVTEIRNSKSKTVLFDVFAGVGPFAVPAAFSPNTQKVYANDLNPVSIQYLNENLKLNKVNKDKIKVFNLDGAEFIKNEVPKVVLEELESVENGETEKKLEFHAVMNLPAMAITFLPHFVGTLREICDKKFSTFDFYCHVHCFAKATEDQPPEWFKNRAIEMVYEQLPQDEIEILNSHFVRNVAGRKDMYCVSLKLSKEVLKGVKHEEIKDNIEDDGNDYETEAKKARIGE
ncbi:unnamed protein product [Bursaphelenchus okinawaensis]|uniref:tRNA (guanine(37)-N1)-methyltransferase n=1 Tax=Bursaphelenchus okinawaensis TaxID=465554 RepID=A0A811L774_9BILA|nr:unnamed protein product [Bursaphelenchus okinawaensis]CAG9117705.1 unnamed protein product [Bursaphelenchus okinawaensis]